MKQPVQYKLPMPSALWPGELMRAFKFIWFVTQLNYSQRIPIIVTDFFSKMWEIIFTVGKYFYLSPNYWRMCVQTCLWSWLLAEKTICDVSRKVSRNCFSQVFLIRAKNLQIWNRNWTFSLSWSKVLKKVTESGHFQQILLVLSFC